MPRRLSAGSILVLAVMLFAVFPGAAPVDAAQNGEAPWFSNVIWQPSLADSGAAIAEFVNQIDASCSVTVEPVLAANGVGPEGAVYAFAIYWTCPPGTPEVPEATWQSAMIWQPNLADAGIALAEHLNQIPASCRVNVDSIVPSSGSGPEGPVYAFLVTWAC